jgi:hypothetical protein
MCRDGMTLAEGAIWALIPTESQWPEFYSWARAAFDLTDDSWDGAGAGNPTDGNLPYGKMMTSIYLITYALRDEYIPQWHARDDYLSSARAADNVYHGPFYSRFYTAGGGEARSETGRVAARDRINYKCPLFDVGGPSDDPANRASVMIHESWHHWQYKYDWSGDHQTGPSVAPGLEGDWYYFHGTGLFDFGTLWTYDAGADPIRFHSPYQVAIEWDGDLAEYSFGWVPLIVQQQARYYGNTRLAQQCKNAIGYRIGDPRPF